MYSDSVEHSCVLKKHGNCRTFSTTRNDNIQQFVRHARIRWIFVAEGAAAAAAAGGGRSEFCERFLRTVNIKALRVV